MPPKRKTRQNLKKGDNVVVTIEDAIEDCLIVSFIFQNKRFSGALMDTTKSGGPYGVQEDPTKSEDELKVETRGSQNPATQKYNHKAPFPPALETRKSYKFDVPQPPMRSIFRRARRSRRKAKLNLLQSGKRNIIRPRGWKFLSHSASCQCTECVQGVQAGKDEPTSSSKRRLQPPSENEPSNSKTKRIKFQDDTPSTTSDEDSDTKPHNLVIEKLESPLKTLLPRKPQKQKEIMERSPMIKITFKSPGGQGRVFKIPSRLHHSPVKNENTETKKLEKVTFSKQGRALKALKRAKSQTHVKMEGDKSGGKQSEKDKCHLRVILEPIDKKNGVAQKSNKAVISSAVDMYDPVNLVEVKEQRKISKHSITAGQSDPQTHSINVTSCKAPNGVFTQGDVVWGKLRGYPWWPSKITKLTTTKIDGKILQQHAEVGWFQCRTRSVIPIRNVQLFQKHFHDRFEKRRKGGYQKAVAAAHEALKEISPEVRKLISQFET
ncbi:PWWP domain-containing protein 2A [Ciona intestinalis]